MEVPDNAERAGIKLTSNVYFLITSSKYEIIIPPMSSIVRVRYKAGNLFIANVKALSE